MSIKSIYPQSQKESYSQNDTVIFQLSFSGEKLKANSVRLSGKLQVLTSGDVAISGDVKYDGMLGIHQYVDSFNTEILNGGFLENIQAYPRAVKTMLLARQSDSQQGSETDKSVELRCGDDELTKEILKGMTDNKPLPFSFTPQICLNKVVSGNLSYQHTGSVMVNMRFAPTLDIFYGVNAGGVKYAITDLQMSYETIPDDKVKEPVTMLTNTMVRNNINSSLFQISVKVPVECLSVSGTFIKSSNLSVTATNNTLCEDPNVSRLEFEINDGNGYVSYPIETREEMLYNYILANNGVYNNAFSLKKSSADEGFGIGLFFNNSSFSFYNQKFGLSVSSDASNVVPYTLFLYFTGVITV